MQKYDLDQYSPCVTCCTTIVEDEQGSYYGVEEVDAEIAEFRRMLARAHGVTYSKDGELQDTSTQPWIDYKRDSVSEIKKKLYRRKSNLLAATETKAKAEEGA